MFVVVDRLSKYAHFCGIQSTYTTSQVARVFMKEIHRLHGFPKVIVSGRDPKFIRKFWKEIWKMIGKTLAMSSTYHPQTDCQTKIVNTCLEGYLCFYYSYNQSKWMKWLPLAEWWYNNTYHTSSKMSPFEALYEYPNPSISYFLQLQSTRNRVTY
jgi:hypothetical protein